MCFDLNMVEEKQNMQTFAAARGDISPGDDPGGRASEREALLYMFDLCGWTWLNRFYCTKWSSTFCCVRGD